MGCDSKDFGEDFGGGDFCGEDFCGNDVKKSTRRKKLFLYQNALVRQALFLWKPSEVGHGMFT